ncbi:amidohydrolase family protein [Alteromonas facilis]|uniref:amidohydrolase family protein n=1 Tax=Alteromonas facilis TaxID=2048004 RepID=UPI000C292BF0|nr:amidohydrolase family protein [Alteromonas facilis]
MISTMKTSATIRWRTFNKGVLGFGFIFLSMMANATSSEDYAIINARILDGNGGPVVEKGAVLISDGKIKDIGDDLLIPSGVKVYDVAGNTVMPGLADMHTHLAWGGEDFDLLGYQWKLNAYLYAGVTNIFDLGGVLPYLKQIQAGLNNQEITGPAIHYVGPLIDSVDPAWPEVSRSMVSETQARGLADYLKRNGASAIKAYAKLNRAQVVELVREGKRIGMPVLLDGWALNGAFHNITAGVTAFAHTPREVTEHTLSLMQRFKTKIITTRSVGGAVPHSVLRGAAFIDNEFIKNTMPPWLFNKVKEEVQKAQANQQYIDDNFSLEFHKKLQNTIKKLHDAGVPLIAGTDDTTFYGDSLHFELELLVDAGLTPLEAITTTTKNAAALVQQSDLWGTLEIGKIADILVVKGKPDENIKHTRNIQFIIKNGNIVNRDALIYQASEHPSMPSTKVN